MEEARDKVLALTPVLEAEDVPLLEAQGQVLAEDAVASFDIPPLDNSAMDGYAVRHADIEGATPQRSKLLRVTGYVAAGQIPRTTVSEGTAVRIMTGAPIPPGADTIVPFEETDEVERSAAGRPIEEVLVRKGVPRGEFVRRAAEDVAKGDATLAKGTVLRASEIGVLASLGYGSVKVVRRPVIAVLATGDELLEPGQEPEAGKIYNSNSYSIAALVKRYGGVPRGTGNCQGQHGFHG